MVVVHLQFRRLGFLALFHWCRRLVFLWRCFFTKVSSAWFPCSVAVVSASAAEIAVTPIDESAARYRVIRHDRYCSELEVLSPDTTSTGSS
jgi:hypothetical protein